MSFHLAADAADHSQVSLFLCQARLVEEQGTWNTRRIQEWIVYENVNEKKKDWIHIHFLYTQTDRPHCTGLHKTLST